MVSSTTQPPFVFSVGLSLLPLRSQAAAQTRGPDLFSGDQEDVDYEEPLPTYEIQPVMLASVDLSCGPGESHMCAFYDYYSQLLTHITFGFLTSAQCDYLPPLRVL